MLAHRARVDGAVMRVRLELFRDDDVGGKDDGAAAFGREMHDAQRGLDVIALDQRLADLDAFGREERVGHRAADDERLYPLHEIFEQRDLGGDLGAADHRHHRALGLAQCLVEMGQLLLHRTSGG